MGMHSSCNVLWVGFPLQSKQYFSLPYSESKIIKHFLLPHKSAPLMLYCTKYYPTAAELLGY
jgi:hypothetical protein